MDKELESLILKYKSCLDQLTEINHKANQVESSEQVAAWHLSRSNTPNNGDNDRINTTTDPVDNKISQMIEKLRLDVEKVSAKRQKEAAVAKTAIQTYIDNTLWKLFSRTELLNNTLIFNNDQNRINDKKQLMDMISTLITIDQNSQNSQESLQDEPELEGKFLSSLHGWMSNIISIYLRICSVSDKKKVLQLLTTTCNISSWAIPLIQFNEMSRSEDYLEVLYIIFRTDEKDAVLWTEDDYLTVLDQLAIDYNYHRLIEAMSDEIQNSDAIFAFTKEMTATLLKTVHNLSSSMNNLSKRLSQTSIQILLLLVDTFTEREWLKEYQEKIDEFICQLVYDFHSLKSNGWFFLPNIPYNVLSVDALWEVTTYLLQIKDYKDEKPMSLDQVLNEHLPSIARFQYELIDNQFSGVFMLSCLTNIVTCIPPGVDNVGLINNPDNTLSACIVAIVSYTLFTIAFIDKQLREIFYKDVRDNLALICKYHAFSMSLLFRWTVQNISVMERMALYLFRSLNLEEWIILKDDLKLLHSLLSQQLQNNTATNAQIQLAKYVIEHLNYGYHVNIVESTISKSQPWHSRKALVLNYETHEEIAFILLDACQKVQPLPDTSHAPTENKSAIELVGTVTNAVSTYLPTSDQINLLKAAVAPAMGDSKSSQKDNINPTVSEFINWAWSIAIRLKLYDCPVSPRATDIEKSINLPFLKLVLNSYNDTSSSHSALVIYISLMLSTTSRHFLRFEAGDGWMKLLVILKRGKPESIIQLLSEMVPSFVYMHGDDFFNDDTLTDFLKHMVELKSDPLLSKASQHLLQASYKHQLPALSGIGLIVGSTIWHAHLIDMVSDLMDDTGHGFSYVDLVMHSWLKTVFHKPDWMWYPSYVSIVDLLCKTAFVLNRHRLVYPMLVEEQKRMETTKQQSVENSPRITRFLKTVMLTNEGGGFTSLLVGEWGILKPNKPPGVEAHAAWFAFEALLMEISTEQPYLEELGHMMNTLPHGLPLPVLDITALHKAASFHGKKPVECFVIYRVASHILVLPVDHVLLPLYLQLFFSLYYMLLGKQNQGGATAGFLFFNKRPELVQRLRDYIALAQTWHGQKMAAAGGSANNEMLQQTYYCMWLWLGDSDLLRDESMADLPDHYGVHRLELCHGKTFKDEHLPWNNPAAYWMDLINIEQLEADFLQFPWEGAEKFRIEDPQLLTMNDNNGSGGSIAAAKGNTSSGSILDDLMSLSTATARRKRFITGESTISPLPAFVLSDPEIKN